MPEIIWEGKHISVRRERYGIGTYYNVVRRRGSLGFIVSFQDRERAIQVAEKADAALAEAEPDLFDNA